MSWKIPIVPASFFAIVLGTMGLGNAWRLAARLWGLPTAIGETIVWVGIVVWAVLVVLYLLKWFTAPAAAKAEIADPIQCCFVGLVGVATMLAGIGLLPYSAPAAITVFGVGGLYTLVFALWRTGLIVRGGRDPRTTTPVLFLPLAAGSFVFATGLSAFGAPDWGQLAFGSGFFTWLAIESVVLHRLYTAEPLAEPLRPTLGILLAPPAVGALAYISASGTAGDMLSHAMIGYAALQALLLLRLSPWITRKFVPSLWAFSFGATALATASETLALRGDTGAIPIVAVVAFVAANLLLAVLAIGTLVLLVTGKLLPARPAASPSPA